MSLTMLKHLDLFSHFDDNLVNVLIFFDKLTTKCSTYDSFTSYFGFQA